MNKTNRNLNTNAQGRIGRLCSTKEILILALRHLNELRLLVIILDETVAQAPAFTITITDRLEVIWGVSRLK